MPLSDYYHHIYLPLVCCSYVLYEHAVIPLLSKYQPTSTIYHPWLDRAIASCSLLTYSWVKYSGSQRTTVQHDWQHYLSMIKQNLTASQLNVWKQLLASKHATALKLVTQCHKCSALTTEPPPSTHHCRRCNACAYGFSHHCLFVDTCIAHHNYRWFMLFLVVHLLMVVYGSAVMYSLLQQIVASRPSPIHHHSTLAKLSAINDYISFHHPALYALFALCILITLALLCMMLIHLPHVLSADTSYRQHKRRQRVHFAEQHLHTLLTTKPETTVQELQYLKLVIETLEVNEWDTGSSWRNLLHALRPHTLLQRDDVRNMNE